MAPPVMVVDGKLDLKEDKDLSDIFDKTTAVFLNEDKPVSEYSPEEKKQLVNKWVEAGNQYIKKATEGKEMDDKTKELCDILENSRDQAIKYAKAIPEREDPTGMAVIYLKVDGNRHLSELIVKYAEKKFREHENRGTRPTDLFYYTDHTITCVFPVTQKHDSFIQTMARDIRTTLDELGYSYFNNPIEASMKISYEEGLSSDKIKELSGKIRRHTVVYELILKSKRELYKKKTA